MPAKYNKTTSKPKPLFTVGRTSRLYGLQRPKGGQPDILVFNTLDECIDSFQERDRYVRVEVATTGISTQYIQAVLAERNFPTISEDTGEE